MWNVQGRRCVESLIKQHQEYFEVWCDNLDDLYDSDDPVSSVFATSTSRNRDAKDTALVASIKTTLFRRPTTATQNIISRKQSIPEMELIINSA